MNRSISITILVDNTAEKEGLAGEHGWSAWIEYGSSCVLFDAGQTDLVIKNATALDINLADANAIVISHGHNDHTGGLEQVLNLASHAKLYLHPKALEQRYSLKTNRAESIGMAESVRKRIRELANSGHVIWTKDPVEILPDLWVTGSVPRHREYENTGGAFYLDPDGKQKDDIVDDQAIYFFTSKGVVLLSGCAHAGVINTMDYISRLTGGYPFHAVVGGLHLLNADEQRLEHAIGAFKYFQVQRIGLGHCTGSVANESFRHAFSSEWETCCVGHRFGFGPH